MTTEQFAKVRQSFNVNIMKRVAVIGAGVSGLVSIKSCLEEDLEPVCYEKSSDIGGVWVYPEEERTDNHGPPCIYEGMLTNICKEMMAFSDFPFPRDAPPYMKGTDINDYYKDYANHFGLLKHINFNTEVVKVEPTDDFTESGRWRVCVRDPEGSLQTEVFDAVMVCTGIYSSGFIPEYPGIDEFKGQILHSCQFRKGANFKDKSVLVVGSCQSAGDVAALCSDYAKKVYISLRDGAWILPRLFNRQPVDIFINQRWKTLIPSWIERPAAKMMFDSLLDHRGLGIQCTKHPLKSSVMVNDLMPIKIMSGTIGVRSGIRRFDGSNVIFRDGSVLTDMDCVIFATGYNLKVPFVDDSIMSDDLGKLDLYLHVIPPRLAHFTLAAIGYIVTRGATGSTSELQARFAIKAFKKEVTLPSLPEMLEDINTRRDANFQTFGRHRPLILPTKYQDTLAEAIGALPKLSRLFLTDPRLAFRYYFGPAYPPCYRLVGPHADYANARDSFLKSSERLMHGITLSTVRSDALNHLRNSGVGHVTLCIIFVAAACALLFSTRLL